MSDMLIEEFGKGCLETPVNPKDWLYSDLILAGTVSTELDWEKGYDLEADKGVKLKHENQGASSSCVAQATKKFGELLNYLETKELTPFSAKRIYSNIFLPQGGSFTQKACEFVVKNGFLPEQYDPSYEIFTTKDANGDRVIVNPPSEKYIRTQKTLNEQEAKIEKTYASLRYLFVDTTIDNFAVAIKNHGGLLVGVSGSNEGWRGADARPPLQNENKWGHLMYAKGFGIKNGKKYIKLHNSFGEQYGEKGDNYIYEDYFEAGAVHRGMALVDKENFMKGVYRLVKESGYPAVYLHDLYNDRYFGLASGCGIEGGDVLKTFSGDYKNAKIMTVSTINKEKIVGEIKPSLFN